MTLIGREGLGRSRCIVCGEEFSTLALGPPQGSVDVRSSGLWHEFPTSFARPVELETRWVKDGAIAFACADHTNEEIVAAHNLHGAAAFFDPKDPEG